MFWRRGRSASDRVHPNTAETMASSDRPDRSDLARRKMGVSVSADRSGRSRRSGGTLSMLGMSATNLNFLRSSLQEVHDRTNHRWVLHPLSPYKTAWDLAGAFCVIYYAWMVPFQLGFTWFEPSRASSTFMRMLDVWGMLDIVLRFRTGVIEYGAVNMSPRVISRAYLRSVWLPIDVLASVPFDLFVRDTDSAATPKTLLVIKYFKLPRLLRIGRFVKHVRQYKMYSGLTIALNAVLFGAHVGACLWVAMLRPCDSLTSSLAEAYCTSDALVHVYWIAFQHGIVSLLGISTAHADEDTYFLDAVGQSQNRSNHVYMWSCGVAVVGAVLTAALNGTVISLAKSWNRAENAFRKRMDHVTHEMEALCLPKSLRARVTAYYDYLWLNNRAFSEQLSLLQDKGMSLSLREQIAIYLFKDYLVKIPFFQRASDAVLGMICMQLRQVIYMPGDFIIREGDIGKELFLIVKGVVHVMPPKGGVDPGPDKKILLGEGDFFGEIGVVMQVQRTRSVRAESMAELCILQRDGLEQILDAFPEFALVMKRLIVQRVGQLCSESDAGRLEQVTALAERQLQRSAQARRHTQKLRGKVRALRSLSPAAFEALREEAPPLPTIHEVLNEDDAERRASQDGDWMRSLQRVRGEQAEAGAGTGTGTDAASPVVQDEVERLGQRLDRCERALEDGAARVEKMLDALALRLGQHRPDPQRRRSQTLPPLRGGA